VVAVVWSPVSCRRPYIPGTRRNPRSISSIMEAGSWRTWSARLMLLRRITSRPREQGVYAPVAYDRAGLGKSAPSADSLTYRSWR